VHVGDIKLDSDSGKLRFAEFDPADGVIYLLTIMMASGKYSECLFTTAGDRDKRYDEILAALAPAVTIIDDSPDVPRKPVPVPPAPPSSHPASPTRAASRGGFKGGLNKLNGS
jgi:hypothetical protein